MNAATEQRRDRDRGGWPPSLATRRLKNCHSKRCRRQCLILRGSRDFAPVMADDRFVLVAVWAADAEYQMRLGQE
jgi:hypothetical protein